MPEVCCASMYVFALSETSRVRESPTSEVAGDRSSMADIHIGDRIMNIPAIPHDTRFPRVKKRTKAPRLTTTARGGEKCHPHGFVRIDCILATDLPLRNNGNHGDAHRSPLFARAASFPARPSVALPIRFYAEHCEPIVRTASVGTRFQEPFLPKPQICVTVSPTYFQTRNLFLLTMIIRFMQLLLSSFGKTRKDLFLTIAVVSRQAKPDELE